VTRRTFALADLAAPRDTGRVVSLSSVVVAARDQVWSELANEAAILSLRSGVYYGLDPVGVRVWRLLQAPVPVRRLRDTLLAEYEVTPDRCERDILALLERLAAEGLIEVQDEG
jgi:coenzyme PQQ synthesis protein D (PqqD)